MTGAAVAISYQSPTYAASTTPRLTGRALCDSLTQRLLKNNTLISLNNAQGLATLSTNPLILSDTNDFPFNISIDIPQLTEKSYRAPTNVSANSTSTNFVVVFLIDEVDRTLEKTSGLDFLTLLLGRLLSTDKKCSTQLLFAYDMVSTLNNPAEKSGIDTFLDALVDKSDTVAIIIRLKEENKRAPATIVSGGDGAVTPSFLTRLVTGAFDNIGIPYELRGVLLSSFYRLKLLESSPILDKFLKSLIPALTITLNTNNTSQSEMARLISSIIVNYGNDAASKKGVFEWDRRSNAWTLGVFGVQRTFWISEGVTTTLFLIITFFAILLSVTWTANLFNSNRLDSTYVRRDIIHLIPLVPLLITMIVLSLMAGESVAIRFNNVFRVTVWARLAIKIFMAFFFSSIFFLIVIKIQGTLLASSYSFFITIIAVLNIFLFSSLDISLFYLFCFEFLVLYFSRFATRTYQIFIFFFLLGAPFIPYLIEIVKDVKPDVLQTLTHSTLIFNILFSFVFAPFSLIWLRILVRLNSRWKTISKPLSLINAIKPRESLALKNAVVFLTASIALGGGLFFGVNLIGDVKHKISNTRLGGEDVVTTNHPQIGMHSPFIKPCNGTIDYVIEDKRYGSDLARELKIRLNDDPERVLITVRGLVALPITYSDFPYVTNSLLKSSTFLLPPNPPKVLTLTYLASPLTPSVIKIQATYPTDRLNIWTQECVEVRK